MTGADSGIRAFTLIEVLLVVMIIMIAAAVAVPVFRGSFHGLALRSTVRDLIMAGRYARARAALQSKQVALIFYLERGRFEVAELTPEEKDVDVAGIVHDFEGADLWGGSPEEELKARISYKVTPLISRAASAGVRILRVSTDKVSQEYEGSAWVYYYPNGMCDGYTVELADKRGRRAVITVSPYSGTPSVEYSSGSGLD
ncbi:MAG: hypothetical protein DRP22_04080 [Verrucomicrobia bacterium]|nr:MAG: hypothetical protein DRP22_04080 [Verrucomicrobiota bacterium]